MGGCPTYMHPRVLTCRAVSSFWLNANVPNIPSAPTEWPAVLRSCGPQLMSTTYLPVVNVLITTQVISEKSPEVTLPEGRNPGGLCAIKPWRFLNNLFSLSNTTVPGKKHLLQALMEYCLHMHNSARSNNSGFVSRCCRSELFALSS